MALTVFWRNVVCARCACENGTDTYRWPPSKLCVEDPNRMNATRVTFRVAASPTSGPEIEIWKELSYVTKLGACKIRSQLGFV